MANEVEAAAPNKTAYKKNHYEFWAGWFIHGGPHIAWLGGVFGILYAAGFVNVPAWSSDVLLIAKKVAKLEVAIKTDSKSINQLAIDSATALQRDISQENQLKDINQKLDILITNALSNSSQINRR